MGQAQYVTISESLAARFEIEAAKTSLTLVGYIAFLIIEFVPSVPDMNEDWVVSRLSLRYGSAMLRAPHEEDGA